MSQTLLLKPSRYLRWLSISVLFGLTPLVIFNLIVDPLGVSPLHIDIPGVNSHKPMRAQFDRLVKPFAVRRQAPRTLFVGSSLVKQAIDPSLVGPAFAPAYNAGLDNGADLDEMRQFLEYYFASDPGIRTVFIEIFLIAALQNLPAPTFSPLTLRRDQLLALISWSATRYSMDTIRFNRAAKAHPQGPLRTPFASASASTRSRSSASIIRIATSLSKAARMAAT